MKKMDEHNRQYKADELTAIRCQLGDRDAFDMLIARWSLPLHSYASRMAGGEGAVEDLLQDIWLRIINGIGGVKDCSKIRSWVFGIAHNAVKDRWRSEYKRRDLSTDMVAAGLHDAPPYYYGPLVESEDHMEKLDQTISSLPLIEREILVLFYLKELSIAETASALAIPEGTVKSRLHRARKLLQKIMNEGEET